MDFNRRELIAKLRKIRQDRLARAKEHNEWAINSQRDSNAIWFDSHRRDMEALRDALNECLAEHKPLALDVLPAVFRSGYLPAVKSNTPPKELPANTSELDAAISLLSAVSNETITANDLSKFGVRMNRWIG